MTFKNIVVGKFNEMAVKASEMIIESPGKHYPILLIEGGFGSGKSLLLKTIQETISPKLTTKLFSGNSLMGELVSSMQRQNLMKFRAELRETDILIIDDFHDLVSRVATQNEVYSALKEREEKNMQTVITTTYPVHEIEWQKDGLEILLMNSLLVSIDKPDFEDRLLLTRKIAHNQNIDLYDDVTQFIAEKYGELRQIQGAVLKLKATSEILKNKINLEFAKVHLGSKAIETLSNENKSANEKTHASNYSDKRDLIRRIPISDIISRYLPLLKKEEKLRALCPFHADTNQSLKLNDEKGFFKCFVCGAGGDAITFVMDFKKIEFIEALREIETWKADPEQRL